ncbi:TPA: hypothetical protein ACH3X3_011353 [Trebouxia sp. C0006]
MKSLLHCMEDSGSSTTTAVDVVGFCVTSKLASIAFTTSYILEHFAYLDTTTHNHQPLCCVQLKQQRQAIQEHRSEPPLCMHTLCMSVKHVRAFWLHCHCFSLWGSASISFNIFATLCYTTTSEGRK